MSNFFFFIIQRIGGGGGGRSSWWERSSWQRASGPSVQLLQFSLHGFHSSFDFFHFLLQYVLNRFFCKFLFRAKLKIENVRQDHLISLAFGILHPTFHCKKGWDVFSKLIFSLCAISNFSFPVISSSKADKYWRRQIFKCTYLGDSRRDSPAHYHNRNIDCFFVY